MARPRTYRLAARDTAGSTTQDDAGRRQAADAGSTTQADDAGSTTQATPIMGAGAGQRLLLRPRIVSPSSHMHVVVCKRAPACMCSTSAGHHKRAPCSDSQCAGEWHSVTVPAVETDRRLRWHMHGRFVHVSAGCGVALAQPYMQGRPAMLLTAHRSPTISGVQKYIRPALGLSLCSVNPAC